MFRILFQSFTLTRHLSSHLKYKLASIFLALLMVYLIIASVLCGIAAASQSGGSVVLLSIAVTYGGGFLCTTRFDEQITDCISHLVYVLSSLLAFDPWHLVTSFLQYLLLSPTYILVLSMSVTFAMSLKKLQLT